MTAGQVLSFVFDAIVRLWDWVAGIQGFPEFMFRAKVVSLFFSVFLVASWYYLDILKRPYTPGLFKKKIYYTRTPLEFPAASCARASARVQALLERKHYSEALEAATECLEAVTRYFGEYNGTMSKRLGNMAGTVAPSAAELGALYEKIETARATRKALRAADVISLGDNLSRLLAEIDAPAASGDLKSSST